MQTTIQTLIVSLLTLGFTLRAPAVAQPIPQAPLEPGRPVIEIEMVEPIVMPELKELEPIAIQQPVQEVSSPAPSPSVIPGCGDNEYAQFIYQKESGCNLNAENPGGCRGIGQACPGSKLPCGADYACQNAWFTKYANDRYGGWAGAYAFWQANGWW